MESRRLRRSPWAERRASALCLCRYALANKETPESLPEKKLRTICEGRNIGAAERSVQRRHESIISCQKNIMMYILYRI